MLDPTFRATRYSTAPKSRSDQQIADAQSAFGEHRSVICANFKQASCYFAPKCCRHVPTSVSNALIAYALAPREA